MAAVFSKDWSGVNPDISLSWSMTQDGGFAGSASWSSRGTVSGLDWTEAQSTSAFPHRDTGETFEFGGYYWLSNGFQYGGASLRDLWKSEDGLIWTQVLDQTPYPSYAQVLPFGGRLYAISNETWVSDDGVNWSQIATTTPFQHTAEQNAVVFANKLWMLAPEGAWSSVDGISWTQESTYPFGTRHHFSSIVFDGKLVISGGFSDTPNDPPEAAYTDKTSFNDVWASSDGVTWERLTADAAWSPRFFAPLQVYNNNLYMLGGFDNVHFQNLDEVWVSSDGVNWTLLDGLSFSARHWSISLVIDGKLELLGGNGWPTLNDIWTFDDQGALPNYDFSATSGFELKLGGGNDHITSGGGLRYLSTGAGNDVITLASGDRFVNAGAGDDTIRAASLSSYSEQWIVGDFDGDGKDDIFRYIPNVTGADVWLSDGTSFQRTGGWTDAVHGSQGWSIGDFNGDGRDDLLRQATNGTGAEILLSTGAAFSPAAVWTTADSGPEPWYVGDFNGDGKADILRYNVSATTNEVWLSDGASFVNSGNWATVNHGKEPWYLGDFNGDGITDIFRYLPGTSGANVWLSDGTKFTDAGSWTAAGHGTERWYVSDVNGDGKDDIFRYLPGQSGANVWLSDGTKFSDAGNWTLAGHGITTWLTGDFNGDSNSDLLRTFTLGGVASVLTSDGSSFQGGDLWGGGDSTVFEFATDAGHDVITGFKTVGIDHDQIKISGYGFGSVTDLLPFMSQADQNVVISLPHDTQIELLGVDLAALTSDPSIFLFG